jgi:DNA modification methylase
MQITETTVDQLINYANNAKIHNDKQVDMLAASIKEFGFNNPILIDDKNTIIAGHGRLMAAKKLNLDKVPTIKLSHLSDAQRKAYILADNRLAEVETSWDMELVSLELKNLQELDFDIDLTGFEIGDIGGVDEAGLTDEDAVPEPPEEPISKMGDVWILGNHRVMCGDSTDGGDVALLMNGEKAQLLHADPPYGMGKEGDGVANDNLYREKLDEFQMDWWKAFRPAVEDNGSAYIWGNPEDLWRLWYEGGLKNSERFTMRNEIVWEKEGGQGIGSDGFRSYPPVTERCLFFMLGEQGFNNNSDNYWDGWDSIRNYLVNEKKKSGLTNDQIKAVTNTAHTHYWTTSQWAFPTEQHYKAIQRQANGDAFKREYDDLKREYDDLKREFYGTRAYFDNAHDEMRDVWKVNRVHGNDRHGHATPKPVEMMERVMKSSLPKDGLCIEPFGGSGSTLIGAEKTNRKCYTMELQGQYVDVIVKRWQEYTGKQATHADTGAEFNSMQTKEIHNARA